MMYDSLWLGSLLADLSVGNTRPEHERPAARRAGAEARWSGGEVGVVLDRHVVVRQQIGDVVVVIGPDRHRADRARRVRAVSARWGQHDLERVVRIGEERTVLPDLEAARLDVRALADGG